MGRDKTAAGTEVGPHASLSSLLSCSLRPFLARTSSHLLVHPSVQPCSAACCAYAARSLSLTHTYHTTHPLNGCRQQLFCAASPKPTNHSVGWALHSSPTCISHATVASHTTHIHTHTHTHTPCTQGEDFNAGHGNLPHGALARAVKQTAKGTLSSWLGRAERLDDHAAPLKDAAHPHPHPHTRWLVNP